MQVFGPLLCGDEWAGNSPLSKWNSPKSSGRSTDPVEERGGGWSSTVEADGFIKAKREERDKYP
jgi:hypothetical protein